MMSFRLEELRRRARDQELMEEIGHAGSGRLLSDSETGNIQSTAGGAAASRGGRAASGAKPMVEAVAKIFEQTKTFKPRFDELGEAIEQIERLGEAAARTFAPLKAFQSHLEGLVGSLQPAKDFRDRILVLARSLDQANEMLDELRELQASFPARASAAPRQAGDLIESILEREGD